MPKVREIQIHKLHVCPYQRTIEMIPNFVQQIASVQRDLLTQATLAEDFWKDDNKERFYEAYMKEYDSRLRLYVEGGTGNYGMGLNELLTYIDQKEQEMSALGRL